MARSTSEGNSSSSSKPNSTRRVRSVPPPADLETDVETSAPAPSRRSTKTAAAPKVTAPSHDEIAARAYALYVERGCAHGSHEEDWLRAEAELRA